MELGDGQRLAAPSGQSRSLPVLLPLQKKSWLSDEKARQSVNASGRRTRSNTFFESMDRYIASDASLGSTALSSSSLFAGAGQSSFSKASRPRPDMSLLDGMGYHGPLYTSLKHNSKRDALLQAQRDGEISKFRAALRGAQLHIGLDDPMVMHMRNILKEADWGVRTCKKCSVTKLASVVSRMNDLDLGPQLWDNPDLAAGRIRFAAWKASLLKDANEDTRKGACDALGALGLAVTRHASDLADCFTDSSYDVRQAAIGALKNMREAGASAAAAHLEDARLLMRKTACDALGQMADGLGAVHAAAVVMHLGDEEAEMRKAACLAFERFGSACSAYAKDVAPLLADVDARVRRVACQALGSMGPAAAAYADLVKVCLSDADMEVQHAAEHAIDSMGVVSEGTA